MNVRIVTDSASDLPEVLVARYGIQVVPLYIHFGSQSYLDGVEMSRREFYHMLPDSDVAPTTSAPSPGSFIQAYQKLAQEGAGHIISIHISASLSNTVNVARLAAAEVKTPPIRVVDGGQLTLATGLLVIAAALAVEAGASIEEIVSRVEEIGSRTYTFAVLDTLEYIRRSGRMSRFAYGLGTWLRIKPLLKMHKGKPEMERIRTHGRAISRLIELVTEIGPLERLALVHTHAPEQVEALHKQAKHLFPAGEDPLLAEVTPVIGCHIGPGVVGFVATAAP